MQLVLMFCFSLALTILMGMMMWVAEMLFVIVSPPVNLCVHVDLVVRVVFGTGGRILQTLLGSKILQTIK
jgi:hypothetical protein